MKVKFLLQYFDYNDENFDKNNNYYGNSNEYINQMAKEVNSTGEIVENAIKGMQNGDTLLNPSKRNEYTYVFGGNYSEKEDKVAYSKCEGILYCEDGKEETVDGIFDVVFSNDVAIYIIKLDIDNAEEEFESSLNVWNDEHDSIQRYLDKMGENWVFENEPKVDVTLEFENKAKETKYVQMKNCKILEKTDICTYIIISEKLELIEKLQ